MKYLAVLFALIVLSGCNKAVPPEVLAQNWIYRSTGGLRDTISPNFLYGDIMHVEGDNLIISHSYLGDQLDTFPLTMSTDSIAYSVSFQQPTDSILALKKTWPDGKAETHQFVLLGEEVSGQEKLGRIREQTLTFKEGSNTYTFRMFKESMSATIDNMRVAKYDKPPKKLSNKSRPEFNSKEFQRQQYFFPEAYTYFPIISVLSFGNESNDGPIAFMITDIDDAGNPNYIIYQDTITGEASFGTAEVLANPRTAHLTNEDIFYLMSEGDLSIDQYTDFDSELSAIFYRYQKEADEDALHLSELAEVGFAFNADGTYDIFHNNRSLASGIFEISKDGAYLHLQRRDYLRPYPLYSDGKDHLAFAYPFTLYTPRPLGEQLISCYSLRAVINFTTPAPGK